MRQLVDDLGVGRDPLGNQDLPQRAAGVSLPPQLLQQLGGKQALKGLGQPFVWERRDCHEVLQTMGAGVPVQYRGSQNVPKIARYIEGNAEVMRLEAIARFDAKHTQPFGTYA